jgi:ubiquinone/menaquinone biosynthesis C-methylase UbiE
MRSGNVAYNSSGFHRALAKLTRLRPGQTVLDLGCGRGRTLGYLLELNAPDGRAVGLDLSVELLELAERAHAREISAGRLKLVQHDAIKSLPFDDGSFDAVLCQNVLECIPEKAAFLRECHRVLRPGGVLVLGHHDFDSVLLASSDRELTEVLVHGYAAMQLPGMASADAQMPQLPALMQSPFRDLETQSTLEVDFELSGDGSITDLLQSLYDAVPPGTDPARLHRWHEDWTTAPRMARSTALPWVCVVGHGDAYGRIPSAADSSRWRRCCRRSSGRTACRGHRAG